MEWLRSIELAEFATNLRGTGVHGGLIALEPGFGGEHFATLLQMSQKKTLLRKHLHNNFEMLLDDEQQQVGFLAYISFISMVFRPRKISLCVLECRCR